MSCVSPASRRGLRFWTTSPIIGGWVNRVQSLPAVALTLRHLVFGVCTRRQRLDADCFRYALYLDFGRHLVYLDLRFDSYGVEAFA